MRRPPPLRTARSWGPPPWLWLTLALFLAQVPALLRLAAGVSTGLAPFGETGRGRFVTALLSLVQLLPQFFLLAAVLALLAPRTRGRLVERRHGLLAPDHPLMAPPAPGASPDGRDTGAAPHFAAGMAAFVHEHAPGAQLRLSTRDGLSARVYPGGWRTSRIGVFAPLVHLWQTDEGAARAVLLHELGHLRRGEHHVAGLGSPLTALVRVWPYVLAGFVVLPVTLLFVTGNATAVLTLAEVVLVLCGVPKVLLLVVAALWSAELGADRFAARTAGADTVVRALRRLEKGDRGGLARLYHPPAGMRVWCVSRAETSRVRLLPALLWPLALAAQTVLTMLGAFPAYVLLGVPGDLAARQVLALAHESLAGQPAWWATLAVALLWPPAAGDRPAGRDPGAPARAVRVRAAAVFLPALLLLVGLLPLAPRPAGGVLADAPADPAARAPGAPGEGTGTGPRTGSGTGTGTGDGSDADAGSGAGATACPSRAAPADPSRPPGLPTFTSGNPASSGGGPPAGPRTFRTLAVRSADPLSGTRSQAREVAGRLSAARWTLREDGTLVADLPEVPLLRTTAVDATARLLTGKRTRRTGIGATTTWMEARLVIGAGPTARLELVRAATGVTRVVVDCREFTSTSTTAQRLSLTLGNDR
ncbi:M48 family metalloprotease [Streptomyces sp. NPDC127038]|uniref:M48 family metalloprotease n=1 Tax=Streptomyces sp. NPDC127038 TaxID=3347114 RepID=UPI00365D853D